MIGARLLTTFHAVLASQRCYIFMGELEEDCLGEIKVIATIVGPVELGFSLSCLYCSYLHKVEREEFLFKLKLHHPNLYIS